MLVCAAAPAAAGPLAHAARGDRAPFIIGTPGRADAPGDRREPRRRAGTAAGLAAYVDLEVVQDATWLVHEVEAYARRRGTCVGEATMSCAYGRRALLGQTVLAVQRGHRAEIVWTSGPHAVRLGWRRIIDTASGTMLVEDPPAELTVELLAAYPSGLPPTGPDATQFQDDEIDRLLHYAERALGAWPAQPDIIQREAAWRLVYGNLAVVLARGVAGAPLRRGEEGGAMTRAILADRLAALKAARQAARQCRATPVLVCPADGLLTESVSPTDQNGMSSSP